MCVCVCVCVRAFSPGVRFTVSMGEVGKKVKVGRINVITGESTVMLGPRPTLKYTMETHIIIINVAVIIECQAHNYYTVTFPTVMKAEGWSGCVLPWHACSQ